MNKQNGENRGDSIVFQYISRRFQPFDFSLLPHVVVNRSKVKHRVQPRSLIAPSPPQFSLALGKAPRGLCVRVQKCARNEVEIYITIRVEVLDNSN